MKLNFNIIKINTVTNINQNSKYQNVSKPLLFSDMKNDVFEKSITNEVSFKGKRGCSEANFEVKDIKNLRCPICGQMMIDKNQMEAYATNISSKTGKALKEALEFYEDERNITHDWLNGKKRSLYRPVIQEVVDCIKQSAIEYPYYDLSKLIELNGKQHMEKLIALQMVVVNELAQYGFKNIEDETELVRFMNILDEYKNRIHGISKEEFKRKEFIHAVSNVTSEPKVQEGIDEIVQKLPTSTNDANSFFVKYSKDKRSAKSIARQFFMRSIVTTEHLHPKSKGGVNRTDNYICDCANCNEQKGNVCFDDWQRTIPNLQERLQQYLYDIQDAFERGELSPSYANYTDEIVETIDKLTSGKIKLEVPPKAPCDEALHACEFIEAEEY